MSESPFKKQIVAAVEEMEGCRDRIMLIFADESLVHLRNRVAEQFNMQIQFLKGKTGVLDFTPKEAAGTIQRVTSFMGTKIEVNAQSNKVDVGGSPAVDELPSGPFVKPATADEVALQELIARIDAVYPTFTGLGNDEILNSLDDLEIRGIAKKAGLPVTETNPEKIDGKFIDQVKDAITKNEEFKQTQLAAKNAGGKVNEADKGNDAAKGNGADGKPKAAGK